MFSGHAISFHDYNESDSVLSGPGSGVDDEEAELSSKVLYQASFGELKDSYICYDTVIWILISLLLVLAWGIGVLMLLYLPFRRYVLGKDISSRKLYITSQEIVYKVVRPSFLPCMGVRKVENRIPLYTIIDIIVEQGCLQAVYGIHTVRIENTARRKAAPVDELHVQGVFNPDLLRKVIVAEASKSILEVGNQTTKQSIEGDSVRVGSITDMSPTGKFVSPYGKVKLSTPRTSDMGAFTPRTSDMGVFTPRTLDMGGRVSILTLLDKLEEVKLSVKNIELLVAGHTPKKENQEIKDC